LEEEFLKPRVLVPQMGKSYAKIASFHLFTWAVIQYSSVIHFYIIEGTFADIENYSSIGWN
jgi:hypothetical protein